MTKRIFCLLLAVLLLVMLGCDRTPPVQEERSVELPPSHQLQFSPSTSGIYNYCPAVMQTDAETAYVYYCTNRIGYQVIDVIGARKGMRKPDGSWSWGEEQIVLAPDAGRWDAHHTCDPTVVAGEFTYLGESYGYLMAYLGCTSYDNQDNKIGLAVAKSPLGPFLKVGEAPLVDFEFDGSETHWEWGVGQPSLVNMDERGRVMLFYTRGDRNGTRTLVEEWDLSDLSAPQCISNATLSTEGLLDLNGQRDFLNNADFVYDEAAERFYAVSDCHPDPIGEPSYIASHIRVHYFDRPQRYDTFTWQPLLTVGESESGFARNHNAGILRDVYGHLQGEYLSVFYTVSLMGAESLWSYRIYDYHIALR